MVKKIARRITAVICAMTLVAGCFTTLGSMLGVKAAEETGDTVQLSGFRNVTTSSFYKTNGEQMPDSIMVDGGDGVLAADTYATYPTMKDMQGNAITSHHKTLLSLKVKFEKVLNASGTRLEVAGARGDIGFRLYPDMNQLRLQAISGVQSNIGVFRFATNTVESWTDEFNLQLSFEYGDYDASEEDTTSNDVRIGVYINGQLATANYLVGDAAASDNHAIFYNCDMTQLGTCIKLYTTNSDAGGDLSVSALVPENLNLTKVTWSDFKLAGTDTVATDYTFTPSDGRKTYTLNKTGIAKFENTSFEAKVTFGSSYSSAESVDEIYFSGTDKWRGLRFYPTATGDLVMVPQTLSDIDFGFSNTPFEPEIALGSTVTTFINQPFTLKITTEYADFDVDGESDDVQLGFWFDGKLYNNQYCYVTGYKNSTNIGNCLVVNASKNSVDIKSIVYAEEIGATTTGVYKGSSDGQVKLVLEAEDTKSLPSAATYSNIGVIISDGNSAQEYTVAGTLTKETTGSILTLDLVDEMIANATNTITVKAGSYQGNSDGQAVSMNITDDFVCYQDKSSGVVYQKLGDVRLEAGKNFNKGNPENGDLYLVGTDLTGLLQGFVSGYSGEWWKTYLFPLNSESGVFRKSESGEEVRLTDAECTVQYPTEGNTQYFINVKDNKAEGDTFIIKGQFKITNGKNATSYKDYQNVIHFEEVRYQYDREEAWSAPQWFNVALADEEDVQFTLDDPTGDPGCINVKATDGFDVTTSTTYIKAMSGNLNGVFVNGIKTDIKISKTGTPKESSTYSILLGDQGIEAQAGDEVVVKGNFEYNGHVVEYRDVCWVFDGGKWVESTIPTAEAGVPDKPVRFTLDTDESYKDADGNWKLLFKAADGLLGDPGVAEDATYSGLKAVIAGETEYAVSFFKNSKSYYEVTIPSSELPTEHAYTIVIGRGIMTGGWEAEAGRYMERDITLHVNGERISDKGAPTGTENVKISYSDGSASEINLRLEGEDAMVVTTKEGNAIYAADEPNSGVFINGVKQDNIGRYKYEEDSNTYYYISFDTNLYKPETDDVVVVNGTFELANYYVTFDTVAMRWNGSAWESVTELANIALNDVEVNASDDAFIVGTAGTKVNGKVVDAGTVLYTGGEYSIVYTIGTATMTQTLNLVYKFTSADNNGAGKADTILPTAMVTGNKNAAGQYITEVKATTHGTTVISMDKDDSYKTTTDYDDYGFDYVVDIKMDKDREFKVLQLSDTQSIDSDQQRYSGRLGVSSVAQYVPEKQYENMQYYIEKVVGEVKPDVILIAGDVVYTEFDDDGSLWIDLIEYMDSLQIPWAPIFGNHDNESTKGVDWQCEQLMNSTYCLFNQRHKGIGGNGNYSIGLARNGELEKAIYLLDSNGCQHADKSGNEYSTSGYDGKGKIVQLKRTAGFYQTQIDWYKKTAMRVNAVAGKVIPSIQCYHIGSEEVLMAARASGYQYGYDKSTGNYVIAEDAKGQEYVDNGSANYVVRPQTGDSGFKKGKFSNLHRATGMLKIMNEVGTTGVFLGHNHTINTSTTYGGVRWTYGLKTGVYVDDPVDKGGTLITLSKDGDGLVVEQLHVELEYSVPTMDTEKVSDNNETTIYLNGSEIRDAMAVSNTALVAANDAECGIFINAVKSNTAFIEKYASGKYKVTLAVPANVGDIVSVYGIFNNSADTHGVYFQNTLAVKWDGTSWNNISLDWLNRSEVTVDDILEIDCWNINSYGKSGVLPTRIVEDKKTVEPLAIINEYGVTNQQYILDNVVYNKKTLLYIGGDANVDKALDVRDLIAMKKIQYEEIEANSIKSYTIKIGLEGLRTRLIEFAE